MLGVFFAGCATALATGLGAIPVFFLGTRAEALRPALWGLAAGVMSVASVYGLLLPALDNGSVGETAIGLGIGVLFLVAGRTLLATHPVQIAGHEGRSANLSVLVFSVLFVHSLPEGMAVGTAYASSTEGLALFVILAIGLQNVPEGTSVAIPMESAGFSRAAQFWAAVGTSAPQPLGAVLAYVLVDAVAGLLPVSFAFAAGAMLALVIRELLPQALRRGHRASATAGVATGAAVMFALSAALNV
jgi:ZIP family zinc transporter